MGKNINVQEIWVGTMALQKCKKIEQLILQTERWNYNEERNAAGYEAYKAL